MATLSARLGIADRIAAASRRIARAKRLDRAATVLITSGGVVIILGVLFLFAFIFAQTLPLLRGARGRAVETITAAATAGPAPATPAAFGVDEYQRHLYQVTDRGTVLLRRLPGGATERELPIPGLAGRVVTASATAPDADLLAAGTSDGAVVIAQVRWRPIFEGNRLRELAFELGERGILPLDPARRPVRQLSCQQTEEGETTVAALLAEDAIAVARLPAPGTATPGTATEEAPPPVVTQLRTRTGDQVTALRLGSGGALIAGTSTGRLYHWELADEPRLTDVVQVSSHRLTALVWALGGRTAIVGDQAGAASAWFRAQLAPEQDLELVEAHRFAGGGSAVTALGASTRDRSFAAGYADGSIRLFHLTSQRGLLRFGGPAPAAGAVVMAPRSDGLLVARTDGRLDRYAIRNPHPEPSWRALFGRVWYEGYPGPEHVWQSTGATDDFEPKLGLVPLVFGTVKATLYALVFAVPIAVMGALYSSQFVHRAIRNAVKPTVEVMAALPSVVVGFVAGLWLAPRVETALLPALLILGLLPLTGAAGLLVWSRLPFELRRRLLPGTELALIVPLLLLAGWIALTVGPWAERLLFGGDARQWLSTALGVVYDQRNSIVVGLAMGFAVIPIIFTISEDAFSAVPQHLTAASLALGASRWQTATRVVLPTASPGIFSAVMIGFGRAVGETMIVLMATGNTPLLDWSPFNGMRTLSANIAVEMPEAPHGGTLYRVLFLSACVLFVMTFVLNTAAELVRQRLRRRYQAL